MKIQDSGLPKLLVPSFVIDSLYQEKFLELDPESRLFDKRYTFSIENEYWVIASAECASQSAIVKVQDDRMILVRPLTAGALRPRNKEQAAVLDALLDPTINVITLTGRAGTGKTLLALAVATELLSASSSTYRKLILTRPMSWVGKHGLGALPGNVEEKFSPYLQNYMCNLQQIFDKEESELDSVLAQMKMEFVPLQLIRGASWSNSVIIADEIQVLDHEEMVALGTRVGEGSKLILMGDLGQRDEKIAREKTGLYKFVHSPLTQSCRFAAHVELVKCERGPVSELFADVFGV